MTVALNPMSKVAAGARYFSFSVTYNGPVPLNLGSVGNHNILVSGPGDFSAFATATAVTRLNKHGNGRVVTYTLAAPGGKRGRWDAADNGRYSITLLPSQVLDVNGRYLPAASLGRFKVALPASTSSRHAMAAAPLRPAVSAMAGPAMAVALAAPLATLFSTRLVKMAGFFDGDGVS